MLGRAPASPTQSLHHHGPPENDLPYFCMTCGLEKLDSCVTFDDYVGWAAHQTVSFVACYSDSDIVTALQTVQTVVRTQRYLLGCQGFCRNLNSSGCEYQVVTMT